jgi:hypothetical protein
MKKKITEIADIQLGYQFRKKVESVNDGTHSVIQIRDVDEHRILHNEGLSQVKIDKLAEQHLINKGDVLFLSRGHRNWATSITENYEDTIAVSHFFVLKIRNESVIPEYIAWYINQAPAQEYLHNIARRGTHIPIIPLSAFKEIIVDLPDKEIQKKIVELSNLMEKEKQLFNELQGKRSQLVNAISLKAIKTNKER